MSAPDGPAAPVPHPDHRLSLATERTLLAWLRTALALVAGGVTGLVLLCAVCALAADLVVRAG